MFVGLRSNFLLRKPSYYFVINELLLNFVYGQYFIFESCLIWCRIEKKLSSYNSISRTTELFWVQNRLERVSFKFTTTKLKGKSSGQLSPLAGWYVPQNSKQKMLSCSCTSKMLSRFMLSSFILSQFGPFSPLTTFTYLDVSKHHRNGSRTRHSGIEQPHIKMASQHKTSNITQSWQSSVPEKNPPFGSPTVASSSSEEHSQPSFSSGVYPPS